MDYEKFFYSVDRESDSEWETEFIYREGYYSNESSTLEIEIRLMKNRIDNMF